MKNKKILIIVGVGVGLIIIGVLLFFLLQNNKTYIVTFDSDGGLEVEKVQVKKGATIVLPNTTKNGYNFVGWFDNNTKVTTNLKVTKDILLKAKWISLSAKTYIVTFDSDGGSIVEELIVECEKELKLPNNPTKEGYEFVSWVDKNEKPILDGALLSCENINLKANWKKIEEKKEDKKEETKTVEKQKTYSCSEGELSGDKCIIKGTINEKCPDGTRVDGSLCINTSDSNGGTRQCIEDTVSIDGKGHTWTGKGDYYFYGNSYGKCAYYKWTDLKTQSQCTGASDIYHKTVWVSELNGCYAETKMNNYETVCASDYQFYSSSELSSKFGIHDNGKCLKKVSKTKYCDDGYTLTNGECIKTISAIAN